MERVCRNCKYFYSNETMGNLYICTNGNSEMLGEFVGLCDDSECADCETDENIDLTPTPNYFGEY